MLEPRYVILRQRGAALLISLIVLLVISVVGISAMNSSIFQERMSANAQNVKKVFHAAESASQDLFKRLETMDISATEWGYAEDARKESDVKDAYPLPMPTHPYTGVSLAGSVETEIRYLGKARLIDGYSLDPEGEEYRERFMLIGRAQMSGSGASSSIVRGVSVVFY